MRTGNKRICCTNGPPARLNLQRNTASTRIVRKQEPQQLLENDLHQSSFSHTQAKSSNVLNISRMGRDQSWLQPERNEFLWCYYYSQEKCTTGYRNVNRLWIEKYPLTDVL